MQRHLIYFMRLILSKPHINRLARSTRRQAPTSLWSLGSWKCVASLSTHETFVPLIWASRYKRLGLGVRLLALATKPTSNIQFTATTRFVFVPQGNFLTFGLRPKLGLPWYCKTIILYTIRGTNMICLGSTKPPSNIPSTAQTWFGLVS